MTNSYFKQVPNFEYVNRTKGNADISNYITVKNLFKRGKIRPDIFGNLSYFTKYKIIGDERPDNIAFKEYEDSSLDWVVLLSNNIIDPYFEWPLSVYDFNQFIKKKYGSIAAAQATTMHCEHKTKDLTVSADSLTVSNGVSSSDYDAIDAYTYWDKINDNRRHIQLINVAYLNVIDAEFKNMV